MLTATRILLTALGVSALIIGAMIFFMGPDQTATFFDSIFGAPFGLEIYTGGLAHVNVDSEMRFFSVFWFAYGAVLLWLAPNLRANSKLVFLAIGLFFAGGVGRLLSFFSSGAPDPLFVALMVIELVGPITVALMFWWAIRARN